MYSQELAATTDYRDVLAEVCTKRFKNPRLDLVFPEHELKRTGFLRD